MERAGFGPGAYYSPIVLWERGECFEGPGKWYAGVGSEQQGRCMRGEEGQASLGCSRQAQGRQQYLEGIFKLFALRSPRYTPHLLHNIRSHSLFASAFV